MIGPHTLLTLLGCLGLSMGYYPGWRVELVPQSPGDITSHALALSADTTLTMPITVNHQFVKYLLGGRQGTSTFIISLNTENIPLL